jgi:peroxiredoxin
MTGQMSAPLTLMLGLSRLTILLGCWLGWQLLSQNGRMLLRLEELENRLDELEFGKPDDEPHQSRDGEPANQNHATSTSTNGDGDRANRFSSRSLARSRLKRDGLKAGASAPDFHLPCLDGTERSLADFRGHRVLLVFSDPHCGPCQALAPYLQKVCSEHPDVSVLMISRGDPKENRAKVKEHGLTFPVLLQQRWEISRLYAIFATPVAYLIDETGLILRDVAVGVDSIKVFAPLAARQDG